jgi:hypothetical protein
MDHLGSARRSSITHQQRRRPDLAIAPLSASLACVTNVVARFLAIGGAILYAINFQQVAKGVCHFLASVCPTELQQGPLDASSGPSSRRTATKPAESDHPQ